jgi:ABC-type lipoprotein release transport system permease subunit
MPTLHPAIHFGTALAMTVVSLMACLIPCAASRVDPMIALRAE